MISVESALDIILRTETQPSVDECPLPSALGRILAEEIFSPHDQPPWDNSAMDGYAVRWEDLQGGHSGSPVELKITEVIPAGKTPLSRLSAGACAKIMTGAQIPDGADTIVPVELTEKKGDTVLIRKAGNRGDHIRRKGEDLRRGDLVLKKGKRIRPAEISMLASLGRGRLAVFQKPVVGILSTGNELADIGESRPDDKIYNSNGYALLAQVLEAGGDPRYLGICRDSQEALSDKIRESKGCDLLVVSGGVSMGDFDFVKDILADRGTMKFWKVAMRPGSPIAYGELNGKPFFGLPGNPVSCMVTFKLFVAPLLKKLGGASEYLSRQVPAILDQKIEKKSGWRSFPRGVLYFERNEWRVRLTGEQGSHLIHSMVEANCLIDLPEQPERVERGSAVSVIPFD